MLKLIPPGKRKGNKFYVVRGSLNGQEIEFSTKTTDETEATVRAQSFAQSFQEGWRDNLTEPDLFEHLRWTLTRLTKSLEDISSADNRATCGIYFLIDRDRLNYLGQSHRIPQRIQQHRHEKLIPFDRWTAFGYPIELLEMIEAAYLIRYRPFFNRPHKGRGQTAGKDQGGDGETGE